MQHSLNLFSHFQGDFPFADLIRSVSLRVLLKYSTFESAYCVTPVISSTLDTGDAATSIIHVRPVRGRARETGPVGFEGSLARTIMCARISQVRLSINDYNRIITFIKTVMFLNCINCMELVVVSL